MLIIRTKERRSNAVWHVGNTRPALTVDQILAIEMICADGPEFEFIVGKFPCFGWQCSDRKEASWFGDAARTIVANL